MRRPPLLNRDYVLVCGSTLCFFASLNMLTPIFPAFLRERAGASPAFVGLFIGLFSLMGVMLRPLIGRSLATRSRRGFMQLGCGVTAVASAAYLVSGHLGYLVPLRLAHGLAIAAFYISASTLVADSAPPERRGEAFSYFSMMLYLGLAGGPAVGLALASGPGFTAAFGVSAAFGALGLGIARAVREPRHHVQEGIEAERHPLVNRAALFPGTVLALGAVGYAATLNFTADFADERQISGRALYFPVLALSVVLVRLFAGTLADRFGRLTVAGPGLTLFMVAVALQASARSGAALLAAAALGGVGFGAFFPSMMAFTVDRVRPVERASAMATFTAAFDVGFGLGSPVLGAFHGATDYAAMYRLAAGAVAAGVVILGAGAARRQAPRPAEAG